MNFLKSLFGKRAPTSPTSHPTPTDKTPKLIKAYDNLGREIIVTEKDWRQHFLLPAIERAWNDPEALYSAAYSALEDGFFSEALNAAQRLSEIDPNPERGACLLGIALMKNERLDEAESVLRGFISAHGQRGVILTNLAKVYSQRGNDSLAHTTLWHALELDPNQDNALLWYATIQRELHGEQAEQVAFQRVAMLPQSWRAQLWTARASLQHGDLATALNLYKESLSRAPEPLPSDLLMQISGDLGNAGHNAQLLDLIGPLFDAAVHGLPTGNNLIKAHLDLGHVDQARKLLNDLFGQRQAAWTPTLAFWDTEIAKKALRMRPAPQDLPTAIKMATIDGPVWLTESSPALKIFGGSKSASVRIGFLGSTAEMANPGDSPKVQLADGPGRLSRAVPLFLAEQMHFLTHAQVRVCIPFVEVAHGLSFVLSGVAWNDTIAAKYMRDKTTAADYGIITHVKTTVEPWIITVRLIRAPDAVCLADWQMEFSPAAPDDALRRSASIIAKAVAGKIGTEPQAPPGCYQVPSGRRFADYLLRLEQLLAVRSQLIEENHRVFLSGEREILAGSMGLSRDEPTNITTRTLLLATFQAMKRCRPAIVTEFADRLRDLEKQVPLSEPFHDVLKAMMDEVLIPG